MPGTVWGPAWVTFRSAPDYIGWAPLPPEADWDYDYGFRRNYADTSKAERMLGWHAQVGLDEGLRRTVEWFMGSPDPRGR